MKAGWMTMPLAFFAALAFLFVIGTAGAGPQGDADGDGVLDGVDNCTDVSNATQTDTDGDFFGNACDADYDQSGDVALGDFGQLRAAFGSSTGDPNFNANVDSDDDGTIALGDFGLLRSQFGGPPGPGGPCWNQLGETEPTDAVLKACADLPL